MRDDGLRAIWIATYAASWIAETERLRRSGGVELDADIAVRAVNVATDAAVALRDAYLGRKIRGTERIAMVRDALGEDLVEHLEAARGRRSTEAR